MEVNHSSAVKSA